MFPCRLCQSNGGILTSHLEGGGVTSVVFTRMCGSGFQQPTHCVVRQKQQNRPIMVLGQDLIMPVCEAFQLRSLRGLSI